MKKSFVPVNFELALGVPECP